MIVTNGTVEYSRTVKPADYESKAAKVTLAFAVDEGEPNPEAVVARVFDMASAEVHRRLGLPVAKAGIISSYDTRPTQEDIDKPREKKVEAAAAPQPDPTLTPASPSHLPEPAAPVTDDPLAITAPATAPLVLDTPVEITDVDLHSAVHQAIEKHKVTAVQIRDLTATFTGVPGKSMTAIEQGRRADFLKALRELRP